MVSTTDSIYMSQFCNFKKENMQESKDLRFLITTKYLRIQDQHTYLASYWQTQKLDYVYKIPILILAVYKVP